MAFGISTLYPTSSSSDLDTTPDLSVDIVFVHGLNGDPLRTWTHPTTNKLWQRDFLPLELPRARILNFGYDAQAAFNPSTGGVVEHSRGLLCELLEAREDKQSRSIDARRPIILIGHSLGGLVIKRALVIAQQEPLYANIYKSLRGVIFFGTPHQGSSLASYATTLLQIPTAVAMKPNPVLLETLVQKSDALVNLTNEYKRHHKVNPYPIVSFYETVAMRGFRSLVVEKESALLTPPTEIPTYEDQIPVSANHREMCRFASSKDKTYKAVVRSIRRFLVEKNHSNIKTEHFLVPNTLSIHFTGRNDIRQRLEESLLATEYVKRQQVFVLYGMGGSGKTQLCLKFAKDHREQFWAVFFIDASSAESIEQGFSQIARKCKIKESMDSVKEFLSVKEHWLLIIDNADDPSLDVSRLIPPGMNGTILITTRNPDLRKFGSCGTYKIDEMDQEDAVTLLLKAAAVEHLVDVTARKSAESVVLQLGNFALAIVQAGAVIRQNICSLESFCAVFSKQKRELLELGRSNSSIEYQYSVFTTWELSLRQIEKMPDSHATLALELLRIFSFMHFGNIEQDIFQRSQAYWEFFQAQGWRCRALEGSAIMKMMSAGWNNLLWAKAVGLLAGFSLISISDASVISIHPLVHEWSRDRMSSDEQKQNRELALMILSQSTYIDFYSQKYAQRKILLLHVDACLLPLRSEELFAEDDKFHEHVVAISSFANLYHSCGRFKTAVEFSTLYLKYLPQTNFESTFRENEYFRIKVLEGLCLTLDGQYEKSIKLQETLLVELKTAQRKDQAVELMCDLAISYNESEQFQKTIKICNEILEECKTLPGRELLIANAEERIGIAFIGLQKPRKALRYHQRALETRKKVLGEQNPYTINSYLCLAQCYVELGRHRKGNALNAKCLAMAQNIEGEEHPQTISAFSGFAYSTVIPTKSRLVLGEEVLALHQTVLGVNHPRTCDSMALLAQDYFQLGRYTKALPLQEEVLRMREEHGGPDHSSTIRARKELKKTRRFITARKIAHFWIPKKKHSRPP